MSPRYASLPLGLELRLDKAHNLRDLRVKSHKGVYLSMRLPLHGSDSSVISWSCSRLCMALRMMRPLPIAILLAAIVSAGTAFGAQTANRITQNVDLAQTQALPNHHPLWAISSNSTGLVPADLPLNQMTLVLSRSAEQEQAFEKFLADQQNPSSPDFHHWLTPAEVGERFGLSEQDIDKIAGWLQSQGLHVNWVSPSRIFIGFGGTSADIGRALQTELRYYSVNGVQRMSVSSDPLIPRALAPAIKAVRGLYTIDERPAHHISVLQSASPEMTNSQGNHFIAPADFATIYDLPASLTGAGETIGIVSWSRTNFADFTNFRLKTGATFSNPTEIIPTAYGGVDPGPAYTTQQSGSVDTGGQSEATLDVLRAGSVAPGAQLLLVASSVTSHNNDGIGADAQYLVNTTPVPAQVMTISFGACEANAGSSGVSFWDALFQQAAAEGMSVFVSSGDSGAAGCDTAFTTPPAAGANSPNYICASSYATCVGGTEFNDPTGYWNSTNGTGLSSALSYIPEGGWNESWNGATATVAASGGGASSFIATPSWQTGTGVPAARSGRYTPDVSFSASGHDGYFGCFAAGGASCVTSGSSYTFTAFSGTSAAAPGMAGVAALLDQKLGAAQGNLNPGLYMTAAGFPAAFHDVTVSSSGVASCVVSTPSMCDNSIPGPSGLSGGQAGYLVTTGYDEVTGLGSLDITSFINNYSTKITPTVTVSPSPSSITTAQTLPVTIAVNGGTGNPTPTGTVILTSGSYTSAAATLSGGSVNITVPAGSLTAGNDTLTASYTPDASSSSTYNSAFGSSPVTVTAAVNPAFTISGTAVTVARGATTGNTSTITVTPSGGFTGSVTLTAAITSSPTGAQYPPTLSFGSTSPVSITGATAGTATLTVSTTAATTGALEYPARPGARWFATGTAALACILLFGIPARRRSWRTMLGMLALLFTLAGGILSCGGGSGVGTSNPTKTTPTVTVTPASLSITTAQPLTVTVAVSGGSGSSTPTGAVTLISGSYTSAASALASGSATISIPAGSLATGTDTLTVTYTPDSSSASTYNSASGSNTVTVTTAGTPGTTSGAYTITVTGTSGSTTATNTISLTVQ
jgi:subtilase family serine protease